MTKYTFVVFHKEADLFLENLQTLGVVDITRRQRAIDEYTQQQLEEVSRCKAAIKSLDELKAKKAKESKNSGNAAGGETAEASLRAEEQIRLQDELKKERLIDIVSRELESRQQLDAALSENEKASAEAAPWGTFSGKEPQRLREIGYEPHFYISSKKRFDPQWAQNYPLYILNETEDKVYFVVLSGEAEEKTFAELQESKLPEKPADLLAQERAGLEKDSEINRIRLSQLSDRTAELQAEIDSILSQLDLHLAKNGSRPEAENTLLIFEGFAPTEVEEKVSAFLEENGVYFLKEKAKTEDNPPISLKNNFFSRLFEPIGDLYMPPKYGEMDLTPYFAPFYMLFFGLCLGDMGYGIVLLIAGIAVALKVPAYKGYGKLVAWLGLGSIIMPALSGTFFGAKIYELFPLPENITGFFFSDLKMFWFAILFGLVQIIFARLLNAFFLMKTKGIQAGLHNIGWAVAIAWATVAYASMETGFSYPPAINYIGLAGTLLILLFTSDNKNIFVRLFKGVAAFYDVTGVFGDMLSYIRLFGLGTAGGILGMVVNAVALQMSGIPYIGWFFTLLMLLFGHAAVLLLSCLGAFVHPMRLTFVEFYKNAGFEGGGRNYKPLTKEKKNA